MTVFTLLIESLIFYDGILVVFFINERMKFRGKIVDPHCMKQFYSKFQIYITYIYMIKFSFIILIQVL